MSKFMFLAILAGVLLTGGTAAANTGTGSLPMSMHPGMDFDLQGVVCNNRYCSYRRYGLRWAMNTTGESIVWQHQDTRFIKIGYITLNEHLKKHKNLFAAMWGGIKNKVNPLAVSRGYYFKYCDAASQTCEYLGGQKYYSTSDLARLFVPVMEVRRGFPVEIAGNLIERRNRIVVTALAVAGGFLITKLTITGIAKGGIKTAWNVAKELIGKKGSGKEVLAAAKAAAKTADDSRGLIAALDSAVPRVVGYYIMAIAGWQHLKSWGWFSSESYVAKYYADNAHMPLFMAVPDMFVASRKEKIGIETLRSAFDHALRGEIGAFVADYQEKHAHTEMEQDEESE